MSKFKFRLATLLRLRQAARDERRGQLAEAYRAEELVEHQQRRLAHQLSELMKQNRRASAPGQLDLDRLLEVRRYELLLRSQQQQAGQQHRLVQAEIERRRETLVEANRQVRVLEELRRKQLQRHRQEENRREAKQLDEAAARCGKQEDEE